AHRARARGNGRQQEPRGARSRPAPSDAARKVARAGRGAVRALRREAPKRPAAVSRSGSNGLRGLRTRQAIPGSRRRTVQALKLMPSILAFTAKLATRLARVIPRRARSVHPSEPTSAPSSNDDLFDVPAEAMQLPGLDAVESASAVSDFAEE